MIKLTVCFFFAYFVITLNSFAQKKDTIIEKFYNTNFRLSLDKKTIPKSFLVYYNRMQAKYQGKNYRKFTIANPNEMFNQFDFQSNSPDRRLICNSDGILNNLYFIYFEKGGAVQGQKYLYILDYMNNKVKRLVALSIKDTLNTYAGLKAAIINKKYLLIQ